MSLRAMYTYTYVSGNCPIFYNSLFNRSNYNIEQSLLSTVEFCLDGRTGRLCGACSDGYGVPLNVLNGCNKCDNIGFLLFIFVELLPTTIFVLVILVFNIKLINGSINGFVFYCQIITIVYPGLTLNVIFSRIKKIKSYNPCNDNNPFISGSLNYDVGLLYFFPCNIFNLDFITVFPFTLCIQSNMTPLGALSFWYVIGFYPLVLILLLYG